jgi:hypothetical protein
VLARVHPVRVVGVDVADLLRLHRVIDEVVLELLARPVAWGSVALSVQEQRCRI